MSDPKNNLESEEGFLPETSAMQQEITKAPETGNTDVSPNLHMSTQSSALDAEKIAPITGPSKKINSPSGDAKSVGRHNANDNKS
jgi:hypothetical protein